MSGDYYFEWSAWLTGTIWRNQPAGTGRYDVNVWGTGLRFSGRSWESGHNFYWSQPPEDVFLNPKPMVWRSDGPKCHDLSKNTGYFHDPFHAMIPPKKKVNNFLDLILHESTKREIHQQGWNNWDTPYAPCIVYLIYLPTSGSNLW